MPTEICGLDEIVGGGLPRPAAIGLMGKITNGKSTLAQQISWNLLRRGFHVLYYAVDDSAEDVRSSMRYYGWDIAQDEREGKFHFIDLFSIEAKTMINASDLMIPEQLNQIFDFTELLKEGQDFCLQQMAENDLLVIVDSLDPLISLLDEAEALYFLKEMKSITRTSNCIGIAIVNLEIHDPKFAESYKQIADMVIKLHKTTQREGVRYIRIAKNPEISLHKPRYFDIDRTHGITIYPDEELFIEKRT